MTTVLIKYNNNKLYEGPAKFTAVTWSFMNFKISWEDVEGKDNQISIENISARPKWSKPLTYYINYAVLKTSGKEGAAGDLMNFDGLF